MVKLSTIAVSFDISYKAICTLRLHDIRQHIYYRILPKHKYDYSIVSVEINRVLTGPFINAGFMLRIDIIIIPESEQRPVVKKVNY